MWGKRRQATMGQLSPPISLLSQYQARPKFLVFAIRPIAGGIMDHSQCCVFQSEDRQIGRFQSLLPLAAHDSAGKTFFAG